MRSTIYTLRLVKHKQRTTAAEHESEERFSSIFRIGDGEIQRSLDCIWLNINARLMFRLRACVCWRLTATYKFVFKYRIKSFRVLNMMEVVFIWQTRTPHAVIHLNTTRCAFALAFRRHPLFASHRMTNVRSLDLTLMFGHVQCSVHCAWHQTHTHDS